MASVLIAQIAEDQEKLWKAALASQGLEVIVESPKTDIAHYLKELKLAGQEVPTLVIMDMGITTTDSSSLQAVEVCRWCTKSSPAIKVLLNNSKQDQILPLKRRWANRLGAEDLLPRIYSENLEPMIHRVAEVAGFTVSAEGLQQLYDLVTRSETSDTTVSVETQGRRLKDVKADEVVRKLAALTSTINEVYAGEEQVTELEGSGGLAIDATIRELTLHEFELEVSRPGLDAIRFLEENTLIPGVILQEGGAYHGFLSRRRILEMLARPFGQELFMKRPVITMYDSGALETLILPGSTSVVSAAVSALRRPEELIYEPVVVQLDDRHYRMLDLHDLLLAQLEIQETATKMLREQAQARMVQMEKMASLGQMLAEVSHDIRNPVNFIYGNVEYLQNYSQTLIQTLQAYQETAPLPAAVQVSEEQESLEYVLGDLPKVVNGIKLGAEQLRNLVTGLQSFSHMEEVVPDVLDVHECIESSLTILSNRIKGNIDVVRNFGREIPEVLGFQGQLIQVFMNILGNAVDALGDKLGRLGADGWQPTITIHTLEEDGYVSIRICDNADGIPPEIQERIFESFFTTKGAGKGTGLGMAITHQIVVQKHKGKLNLHSPYIPLGGTEHVTGTEFQILLPTS